MTPHAPPEPRALVRAPVRSGWPAFDRMGLLRPGRILLLDVGAPQGDRLALDLLAGALARGPSVVLDGAGWTDVYALGEAAQRHGAARADALARLRIARAFTCHQLQTLVEDALPRLLRQEEARLVLLPGLPDLYQDDDLRAAESQDLFARALAALRRHARDHEVPVAITNRTLAPHRPGVLRRLLESAAHARLSLLPAPHGGLRLARPGAPPVLAPAPGARQRLLDEFGARAPATGAPGHWRRLVAPDPRLKYRATRAGEHRVLRAPLPGAA